MIRALFISFGFNAIGSLFGGLATILVVAALAPQEWGEAAAVLGIGQLIGAALSFGSQVERVRRYSRAGADQVRLIAGEDAAGRLVLAILLCLLAVGTLLFSPIAAATIFTAAGVFLSLGATNHLIAARRFVFAGLVQAAEKSMVLGIVAYFVLADTTTVISLPLATGVAGFAVSLVTFIGLRPSIRTFAAGIKPAAIRSIWVNSPFLGVASLAPSLLLLDVSLVLIVTDSTQAGLFAVASKLTAPLSIAATAVVAVLLPHLSASQRRTLPPIQGKGLIALVGLAGLLTLFFASASYWVPILFGPSYIEAVWPVRFYILDVVVILGTRALVTILQAWDDERVASFLVLGQVGAALLCIGVGALLAGATGASLAVLSTNVVLGIALLWRVRMLGHNTE